MTTIFLPGNQSECGVVAETSFGAIVGDATSGFPVDGLDFVMLNAEGVTLQAKHAARDYQDKNGLTRLGRIALAQLATWALSMHLRPGPTQGTAMDGAVFLTKGGFSAGTNRADAAAGVPTTTTFDVADGTKLSVGQILQINHSTDGVIYRQIIGIATNTVTVRPAMASAPTATDVVNNGLPYLLNGTMADAPDSVQIAAWKRDGYQGALAFGAFVKSGTITFGANEPAVIKLEGEAQRVVSGGLMKLNGAINNSVTTLTLDDSSGLDEGLVVKIDTEAILLGTRSGETFTGCTRGWGSTAAASHNDDADVMVYQPTVSYQSQAPIAPKDCHAYIWQGDGNAPYEISISQGTFQWTTGAEAIGPFAGSAYTAGRYQTSKREASITLNGYLVVGDGTNTQNTQKFLGISKEGGDVGCLIVIGAGVAAGGGVFAIVAPTCKVFETPDVADSGDAQIPLSLKLEVLGTTLMNDEFAFGAL